MLSEFKWNRIRTREDVFCMDCGHAAAAHRIYSRTCSDGSYWEDTYWEDTRCKCEGFEYDEFEDEIKQMRSTLTKQNKRKDLK